MRPAHPELEQPDLEQRLELLEREVRSLLTYARVIAAVLGLNVVGHAVVAAPIP